LGFQAYGPAAIAYSTPPKVPKERLGLLQKAFMDTMKDPEFLTEIKKASLVVNPIEGPAIARVVAELYKANPKLISRFKEITEVTPAQK
jgi:tripartite-type tricarboxylate transporter receptor subunit TctC